MNYQLIFLLFSTMIARNYAQPFCSDALIPGSYASCADVPAAGAVDYPCCEVTGQPENCISCPVTPSPTTPAPTTPAPTTPAPTTPAPTTPAPTTPAPTTPAPTTITTTITCTCPPGVTTVDYSSDSDSSSYSSDSSSSSEGFMADVTTFTATMFGTAVTEMADEDYSDSDSSSSYSYSGSSSSGEFITEDGCICTTAFVSTLEDMEDYSSDSDSSSDSGSLSSDSYDYVAAHVAGSLHDDNEEEQEEEVHYTMSVNFSSFTLMNIWGLFGVLMIANILCCFLCSRGKQTKKVMVQDEDGGSRDARLDILA